MINKKEKKKVIIWAVVLLLSIVTVLAFALAPARELNNTLIPKNNSANYATNDV